MTITEKMEMYKGKKAFIKNLSNAFEGKSIGSSVEFIDYEVYTRKVIINKEPRDHFVEYVIVHFVGGAKSVKFVSGNSCTANFRVLGTLIDGGYYDENTEYDSLSEKGFTKLDLTDKSKLDECLAKPMNHISDVRECFNYCENGPDVERVIKMIPSVFGTFDVFFGEDEETFLIVNEYEENGEMQTEEVEYEFYEEEA